MELCETIRRARKAQKMRQEDISKLLNVSVDTYRRWEQGKHSIKTEKLLAIARVLDVTVKDLTGRE